MRPAASSRGRGTRAAGWLRGHAIDSGDGDGDGMESPIPHKGIKDWALARSQFVEWMDGYDAASWAG